MTAGVPGDMTATGGTVRRLVVGLIVAITLLTLPPGWQDVGAIAAGAFVPGSCSRSGELRATTCRLTLGESLTDTLDPAEPAIYRVDALTPDARLDLTLTASSGARLAVVNWRGDELGSATPAQGAADAHLVVALALPGVYGVRISADDPSQATPYNITGTLAPNGALPTVVWPPSRDDTAENQTGERQLIRTPRGGTPAGGVAIARALGAPPDAEVGDFTLVSDVHVDEIAGPSGLTVRFRYEPEAGGGSGYLLTIDPFAGEAYLDSFEEGRRRPVVGRTKLPVDLAGDLPRRLIVQASGPDLSASLDGQELLRATDAHYARGLIAVGAVTWSDPVGVIFDHLLVVTPAS